MDVLAAIVLIVLHSLDGFEIIINPEQVVILRPSSEAAKGTPNQLIVTGVRCIVGLSDGKFVSVIETCEQVRVLIEKGYPR